MSRLRVSVLLALLCAATLAGAARADRRYFVDTYTPYLAQAGSLEGEFWATARSGQGDSTNTAWENRAEFEMALTDRMTGALYFNFVQSSEPDAPQRFDGPSIELIYQLAEPGKLFLDPAAYFEVRENGTELELEPKLLLGLRRGGWVGAANVIGEIEYFHNAAPGEEDHESSVAFAGGVSRELGAKFALGLEANWVRHLADGGDDPTALFAGPTLNFQTTKAQFAIGWHPQVWGSPESSSNRNLASFERSELRIIFGISL